jgi:hypothetical protein
MEVLIQSVKVCKENIHACRNHIKDERALENLRVTEIQYFGAALKHTGHQRLYRTKTHCVRVNTFVATLRSQ